MEIESDIQHNYRQIIAGLPPEIELVAVSKTHPARAILQLYQEGHRVFGENKVQELLEKASQLPPDIKWHLIGHLQTNKVKFIAPFIDTVQSVDSEKILKEIDKQAAKFSRKIKILLQVKIAVEDSKYGLEPEAAKMIFDDFNKGIYPNVEITGLMGMATFTENNDQISQEFLRLKSLFDELSTLHPLTTLSMGMSGDFRLAIDCGATCVRIGSGIFGDRQYDR